MRLLAGLLSGAAVAVLVVALTGVDVSLLRLGRGRGGRGARPRPRLFRHFEAEGIPARRGLQVSLIAGASTFAVLWAATTSVPLALVAGGVVGILPSSYYGARGERRDKEQRASWPDALRSLIGSLNAGRTTCSRRPGRSRTSLRLRGDGACPRPRRSGSCATRWPTP